MTIVSPWASELALVIAARRDPGPLSLVLVTNSVALPAGAGLNVKAASAVRGFQFQIQTATKSMDNSERDFVCRRMFVSRDITVDPDSCLDLRLGVLVGPTGLGFDQG